MKFSAKVYRCCLRHDVPVALENPHTSRLWLAPPIRHLLQHKDTSSGYTDFCMDGKPFRKRTRLMWSNVDLSTVLRHCASSRGNCSRTGANHVQLQGTSVLRHCASSRGNCSRTGANHVQLQGTSVLRHCASSRGICSSTGANHVQLPGTSGGQFLTLWAQPYPHRLCQRLATAFHAAVMQKFSEPLWEIFQG